MNKILLIIALFFFTVSSAADSIVITKKDTLKFTQKDIKIENGDSTILAQFLPNFKTKYKDSDFVYEVKVQQSGLWDRFKEWLAIWFKKLFGITDNVSQDAVDITLNIIAAIIVLYVIYLIVKVILNKEGQWIFGKSTTKKIINHNDIERNLQNVNFEKLIQDTLKSGNQRLAIRYYYLWLLKKMSEKNIIDWNPEKTNSDYQYEIVSPEFKKEFQYASYLYNYIWYGEFEISASNFDSIKKTFETTLQSL